jgi:pimeloyl-ACP methyl ester carboxylesterase
MWNFKNYLSVILLGLGLVGLAAVVARYLREISAARATLDRLGSQVIETACGPIEYARTGTGRPVLVVHGAMGGFDQGLMLAKLIDPQYQIIAVSRFGYLRSPLPGDASVNGQADAYACLLDALGIQQTVVFGTSGGATSAIRFAARYPERTSALILLSPAAPGKVKVEAPPKAALLVMRNDFIYWALVTYFRPAMQRLIGVPEGLALTPEDLAEVKQTLATTLPASGRIDGFDFDNNGMTAEFYAELSDTGPYPLNQIKTPVLVINAMDDPLAIPENVRGLAEKFPNARRFTVPKGGHLILGHAQEIKAEINQFLNSQVAGQVSRP